MSNKNIEKLVRMQFAINEMQEDLKKLISSRDTFVFNHLRGNERELHLVTLDDGISYVVEFSYESRHNDMQFKITQLHTKPKNGLVVYNHQAFTVDNDGQMIEPNNNGTVIYQPDDWYVGE